MKHFTTLAIVLALAAVAPAAETHAYRAARLWPGDGPVVADAVLIVRDGKVAAAGRAADIKIPDDAVIHDLGDAVLIPGLVIAETSIADRGRDDLLAMTPNYRAGDGFDPYADYTRTLLGGVTTVQLSPGNKRLLPGQGSVVKLAGSDVNKRILRDEESLRLVLGDAFKNPPKVYEPPVGAVSVDRPLEPTRPQLAGSLPTALAGLRASFQAARTDKTATNADPVMRAFAEAGTERKPLRVFAPTAADVQAALDLAREFDLKLILVEPAIPSAEQLKTWKSHVVGVVLSPGVRPGTVADGNSGEASPATARGRRRNQPVTTPVRGSKPTDRDDDGGPTSPAEAAKELQSAGFRVAFKTMQDVDLKETLYLGGLFTTQLSPADALKMVTADSAALLGVGDRVGTLAEGKDADFVVLSGDPFELHTRVRTVYVEGKSVADGQSQSSTKVIRAGRVLNGLGDVIVGGSVLVEGKTIRSVGRDVAVPSNADETKFANAVIVPGFLDLANGLGLGGPLNTQIPINTKLGARLVSTDPAATGVRQSGITTVLLAANTTSPTPVLAFKLGERFRAVKDPVAIKLTLSGNLTQAGPQLRDTLKAGKAYADSWAKYETDFAEYERKKKEYDARPKPVEKKEEKKPDDKKPDDKKSDEKKPEEKKPEEKKPEEKKADEPKPPSKPQLVESLELLRDAFAGRLPVMIDARREDAIRLAVAICRDEYSVPMVLVGAEDAWRVADLLEAKKVAVVTGPQLVRTVDRNEVNLPLSLSMRNVPVGFQSQATAGAKQLPGAVGFAVRHGLGAEEALKGLTSSPAKFLKLDSVGELAVGKDADLVVLSGMPFELSTRVLAVMIDGQWVYRESE